MESTFLQRTCYSVLPVSTSWNEKPWGQSWWVLRLGWNLQRTYMLAYKAWCAKGFVITSFCVRAGVCRAVPRRACRQWLTWELTKAGGNIPHGGHISVVIVDVSQRDFVVFWMLILGWVDMRKREQKQNSKILILSLWLSYLDTRFPGFLHEPTSYIQEPGTYIQVSRSPLSTVQVS